MYRKHPYILFCREKLTQRQFQEGAHILLSNLVDRLEDKPVAVTLVWSLHNVSGLH